MNNQHLPSYKDITPSNGVNLDEAVAAKVFLGIGVHQAEKLCIENFYYYSELFGDMGSIAFEYYSPAIYNFFCHEEEVDRDEFIDNCYALEILFKVRMEKEDHLKNGSTLIKTLLVCLKKLDVICDQYDTLVADGNISWKLKKIENLSKRIKDKLPTNLVSFQ